MTPLCLEQEHNILQYQPISVLFREHPKLALCKIKTLPTISFTVKKTMSDAEQLACLMGEMGKIGMLERFDS